MCRYSGRKFLGRGKGEKAKEKVLFKGLKLWTVEDGEVGGAKVIDRSMRA